MSKFELNENFYKELAALFDKMNIEPLIIIGKDKGNGMPQLNIIGPYPLEYYKAALQGALNQFEISGRHVTPVPGIVLPLKKS